MSKRAGAVAIVLVAWAVAGCGRKVAPAVPTTGARAAARAFFEAVAREDWPAAFALLTPEEQARLGPDGFAALGRKYRDGLGFPPDAVALRGCEEQGERATGRVVLGGKTGTGRRHVWEVVTLHKKAPGWGVVLAEGFGRTRR